MEVSTFERGEVFSDFLLTVNALAFPFLSRS